MRPQLPVLAILAVLAVPPSLAFADGEPPATTTTAQATVDPVAPGAPATPETPTAPVTPVTPPASTTTVPGPAPTPATPVPMPTPERTPAAPEVTGTERGTTDRATAAERRQARRAAARRRAERAADARRAARDRDAPGARDDADDADEDAEDREAARTAKDVLDAPATGLSALSVARFRIPPFLLPIYQAAGVQYGIRWEVLAAINEIETDYGRNLNVSSAGAQGWMQFMPATWRSYGVDANGDGEADPYNPVDAVFAAARYLKAAGGKTDIAKAVFAYNHAGWYVDDVLERAKAIAGLPADVVSSLTGLTLAQPPVHVRGAAREADAATSAARRDAGDAGASRRRRPHRDGLTLRPTGPDRWARIGAPAGSDVVAVQDATVIRMGDGPELGRFIELRDAYGNRYKYAHLDELATRHLVARPAKDDDHDHEQDRETESGGTGDAADGHAADGRGASAGDAGSADAPGAGAAPDAGGAAGDAGAADPVPDAPATAGRSRTATRAATTGGSVAATRGARPAQTPRSPVGATSAGAPRAALGPARPRTAADDGGPTTGRGASGPGDDAGLRGTPVPTLPTVRPPAPATSTAPPPAVPAIPAVPVVPATPSGTTPTGPGGTAAGPGVPSAGAPGPSADGTAPSTPGPVAGPTGAPSAAPGAPAATGPVTGGAPGPGAPAGAPSGVGPFAAAGAPLSTVPGTGLQTDPADPAAAPTTLLVPTGLLGRALPGPIVPAWRLLVRAAPAPAPTADPAVRGTSPEPAPEGSGTRVDDVSRWMVRAGSLRRSDVRLRPLRKGSKVLAGSILGTTSTTALRLAIRPAGEGSPRIDPRPIVAGWRLLDDASVFGHDDRSELVADRGDRPDVGRILLMSKAQLQARVLADPRLSIYEAGRDDIRTGAIDRRVLATMEYLTAHGLRLSITSLKTGHSILSASGNVSAHSYGSAMDIAAVNGVPITGHQGAGSITASTIWLLLRLQGTVRPNQIISLMTFDGADNTMAMADHDDHIHVGFPRAATDGDVTLGRQVSAVLQPSQWGRLVGRLADIENPTVRRGVSDAATAKRARRSRDGGR